MKTFLKGSSFSHSPSITYSLKLIKVHFSLNAPKLSFHFLQQHWCIWRTEMYSVWRIRDSSRACMCSFISSIEYVMSFTDFLLVCFLWSKPTVMPVWTIPPCNIQQHHWKCCFLVIFKSLQWGQWNAQAVMRIDLRPWVGKTTIWSRYHQPLKDLNKMEMVRLWAPAGW